MDGHQFEIESIDILYHEVRLKDLTFQEQNGFPVFRAENYDVVLQWVRDAAKSQENTADAPVKMKEIVIDLRPREEPEKAPEPPVERHNFRITDDALVANNKLELKEKLIEAITEQSIINNIEDNAIKVANQNHCSKENGSTVRRVLEETVML